MVHVLMVHVLMVHVLMVHVLMVHGLMLTVIHFQIIGANRGITIGHRHVISNRIGSMDLTDHVVVVVFSCNLNVQRHAWLKPFEIDLVYSGKIHGHCRPLPVIDGIMRQRQHPVLGHQAFNTCADPDRCGHRSLSLIIRTMVHAPKVRGFAGLGINQKLC